MFGTPDDADQAATVHVDVKCMLCHRPLTRPSSIDARMGKDCADKAGLGQ
jgi:hypothetical protein